MATESPATISSLGMESDSTGARFATVTPTVIETDAPPGSVAVTASVAAPAPTATTARVSADTEADATAPSETSTAKPSVSPSGSLKWSDRSMKTESDGTSSRAGMESATTGGRFGTATTKFCVAESPPGSRAVTVISLVPRPMAASVSVPPETVAVATAGSWVSTAKESASPSGSLKCAERSIAAVSPTAIVWAGIAVVTTGERLGGSGEGCMGSSAHATAQRTISAAAPASRALNRRPFGWCSTQVSRGSR